MDLNSIDEAAKRRALLAKWLVKAWDYATDHDLPQAADVIAELLDHVDELDYPLFELAASKGVTGGGKLATLLYRACGVPVSSPHASDWEREINYSPVIALEESVWRQIHGQLNWVNRNRDKRIPGPNFYLWSEAANPVLFVIRRVPEETDDD